MPSGPLAILPMLPCPQTNRYRSGLVWAKPFAYDWSTINNHELALQIKTYFPFYGELEICSQRWTYPLSALTVNSYIDHRIALIGDAAHVVHPIAGQGVNLGWRDAAVLADQLARAYALGLDIGSATVLNMFNQKRLVDHQSVLWATDGIHRLFSYDHSAIRFVRNTGFALVNHLPPLKKFLMRKAMGG
jgi:2-octaprenyl-6-methoxyphenol hydroxylase